MAAGTVLAIGNLGLNQVLIARVQTHRITAAWWVAIAAMLLWLVAGPGSAADRVAPGFRRRRGRRAHPPDRGLELAP